MGGKVCLRRKGRTLLGEEETTIHLSGLPKESGQDAFSYSIFNSFYPKMIATFAIYQVQSKYLLSSDVPSFCA